MSRNITVFDSRAMFVDIFVWICDRIFKALGLKILRVTRSHEAFGEEYCLSMKAKE